MLLLIERRLRMEGTLGGNRDISGDYTRQPGGGITLGYKGVIDHDLALGMRLSVVLTELYFCQIHPVG